MGKRSYNKGAAMGLRLAEGLVERNNTYLERLHELTNALPPQMNAIRAEVNRLLSAVEDFDVERVYGIVKSSKLEDLQEEEKIILMRIICTLANRYGSTAEQKEYSSRLCAFLNVNPNDVLDSDYDGSNLRSTIDSLQVHNVMYQVLKEYLYLHKYTHEYTDTYETELGWFSRDIDNSGIESIIDLKVCLFGKEGLIEQFNAVTTAEPQKPYLCIESKEKQEIGKECATVFFKVTRKQKHRHYCESASYVVFPENDSIVYVHKSTAVKKTIPLTGVIPSELMQNKQITTYQDMVFYVVKNNVFFYDLNTGAHGFVIKLPEAFDNTGEQIPIKNISFFDGKLIYGSNRLYVLDLKTEERVSVKNHTGSHISGDRDYMLCGGYIYFLVDIYPENKKLITLSGQAICKYGLLNDLGMLISQPFAVENIENYYPEVFFFRGDENYIGVIMAYDYLGSLSSEKSLRNSVCIDVMQEDATPKPFYLWSSHIYQVNIYRNNLVYINADKAYSIVVHDMLTDKKRTLVKQYGHNQKSTLFDRLTFGKSSYQHPKEYAIIGKWLCYTEGYSEEKIISIV